jgi:hypothetical protein
VALPTETDLRAAIAELADAARFDALDEAAAADPDRPGRPRVVVAAVVGAIGAVALVAVLVATLTGRGSTPPTASGACRHPGALTPRECVIALRIAHHQAVLGATHRFKLEDGWPANIRIVTARAHPGTSVAHNAGPPCLSGRLLSIDLIGRFPYIAYSPLAGHEEHPVHDVSIDADAVTGRACLSGIRIGHAIVAPGATVLFRRE